MVASWRQSKWIRKTNIRHRMSPWNWRLRSAGCKLEGELSVSTLAAYEHVSQQAITQRLELLRSTGYVTQHADSKDRRRRLVGLTDEGHAFLAHVTASQTTWLAHAIEYALDDGERGDLAAATTLIERIAATESLPTGGDTR